MAIFRPFRNLTKKQGSNQSAFFSTKQFPGTSKFLDYTFMVLMIGIVEACKDVPGEVNIPRELYSELVWNDEFDGSSVDTSKWEFEVGDNWFNNELQAYTSSSANSFVSNSSLFIQANKENLRAKNYTSARMRTKGRGDWKFGKIEVRAKLPKGKGIWPAIWMLPTDQKYGTWPRSGEIDIMEMVGHQPQTIYGTIHYGTDGTSGHRSQGTSYTSNAGDFSDSFHTYAIIWEKDSINWFVDGKQYFGANSQSFSPFLYPFNERFHLILNVAVGGIWPGNPDSTTIFPQRMQVDHVRVYTR